MIACFSQRPRVLALALLVLTLSACSSTPQRFPINTLRPVTESMWMPAALAFVPTPSHTKGPPSYLVTPPPTAPAVVSVPVEVVAREFTAAFGPGEYRVFDQASFSALTQWLNTHPGSDLEVVGHSYSRGQ